jgi:multiple sugar transport system permease protein
MTANHILDRASLRPRSRKPSPPEGLNNAKARSRSIARTRRREERVGWAMLGPAVLLLIVFVFVPALLAFGLAFTNARLMAPYAPSFVGLDNFVRLFQDETFWHSLVNVAYFAIVVVPVQSALALAMALLINVKVRGVNFFRTLYFLPVVTSMVVVSLLWLFIYRQDGLLNEIIDKATFGLVHGPDWLNNTSTAMPAIILMSVWQAAGFHMIIWLSGLQTIPADLYEAAAIDGVGGWQRFRYITWPSLRPTRNLILVTITIQALSLFTQVNVMTQGGPLESTSTIVYQAVQTGFQQQETSYASAISLVFFVLVLIISGVQRYLTREKS